MALFSIPAGGRERNNARRRNIVDLGLTTAAHALDTAGIREGACLFCGRHSKALPVVRQLIRRAGLPFVLIGTRRDLYDSPLLSLDHAWEEQSIPYRLSPDSGVLILPPGAQSLLSLKEALAGWEDHRIILCLGGGLQADHGLLDLLSGTEGYVLISEALPRSVKGSDTGRLSPAELISYMDAVFVSAMGAGAKALLEALPAYESEHITNTVDYSTHQDAPHLNLSCRRGGEGFRLSQSRTLETRPILTQEDLTALQDSGSLLIHNVRLSHTWVARISK